MVNSSLVLPSVGRQDSGEYICRASNRMGASQATIKLDVESEHWDVGGAWLSIHFLLSNSVQIYNSENENQKANGFRLVLLWSPQLSRTPRCCPITWLCAWARSSGCSVWPTVLRP